MPKKDSKFYELSISERLQRLAQESGVAFEDLKALSGNDALTPELADHMVENAVGVFSLPLGIARNFLINGQAVLVPMAVEEPSVIAGASFMAKLAQAGGGFRAETDPPEMIGQLQLLDLADLEAAKSWPLAWPRSAAAGYTCASFPTWQTGGWRAPNALFPFPAWDLMPTALKPCATASSRPGRLPRPTPTALPRITRAS